MKPSPRLDEMETRFMELAPTDLSDQAFFDEVFLDYIWYVYPNKETCVSDLAQIRNRLNQNDPHIQYHLRDKIEQVLYRYHKMQQDIVIAEKIILKRKIELMEEQIQSLIRRIDALSQK
jgi:hypothetical protein